MDETTPLRAGFGRFYLDEAEVRLELDGRAIELAPRSFQVLCELLRHPGQLVSKEALLDAVWGHRHVNEAALKNIVSQLRQALGDDARESRLIQTVARRGYRFIAPLTSGAQPKAETTSPTQTPMSPPGSPVLAGRDQALGRLRAALAASQQGQRQIAFVLGEAGIGKSALVERLVAGSDSGVAFGQCIEHYGGSEPYMPVLDALNALCRSAGGQEVVAAVRRFAPSWLLQLPWFAEAQNPREALQAATGTTQDRMLREFGELIDHITAERPLLMVLEDLHWADHATVQLLGYLARRRGSSRLMVLGTFRPMELILQEHPLAGLRQELRLHRLCLEIDLEALSETELRDFLAARFAGPVPEAFVRALHAHTAGLPLFVVNVVDELLSEGRLRRGDDGWEFPDADSLGVPRSIVGVIERQIARLTPEQQQLLGAASVAGVEFVHLPLAEVLQKPAEEVQARLDEAVTRVTWLRCVGASSPEGGRIGAEYVFAHTLYRQVLYERLPAPQKLLLHRRWAAALAAMHGSAAGEFASELALHYERGASPAEAAAQLAIAATRALTRGAGREALHAARHGLQLGQDRVGQPLEFELRVLEAVALTRLYVSSAPEVAAAFERATAMAAVDNPAWPRALHGSWWVHFTRGELTTARSLAKGMLGLAERQADPALRLTGQNAMGFTLLWMGELGEARIHLDAAVEAHRSLVDTLPPTQFVQDPGVEALSALSLLAWLVGDPRRARQLSARAVNLAVANRHPLSEVGALWIAAMLHALAGEFETVHALTERLYGVIRDQEVPEGRSGFAWLHGRALVALGQVDEGLAEMRTAMQTATALGLGFGLCEFHHHYAQACRTAGRQAEARASIDAGLALAMEGEGRMMLSPLLLQLAEVQVQDGNPAGAAQTYTRAIETARTQGAVLHELLALASARRLGSAAADDARLRQLLLCYAEDASPAIDSVRSCLLPLGLD